MNIKKQALTSAAHSEFTLEALKQIAPSAFTEVRGADGELTHKVNFDTLRELLGDAIADTDEETFGFQWVGKQAAKRAAAEPTRQTLRPVVEDSADWDTTENLYIEGDNLEVLKLLQRAYLGKVKMIYIDPPYNTGNDFVYEDDFAMSGEEMDEAMGNVDEEGNRLRRNLDSNPRYHSDWCSMIYSRLLVARTLLANDGVIFISIDDNEVHHLRKICDEVFGAENFIGAIAWRRFNSQANIGIFAKVKDTIFIYARSYRNVKFGRIPLTDKAKKEYQYRDERGVYARRPCIDSVRGSHSFEVLLPNGSILKDNWIMTQEKFESLDKEGLIHWPQNGGNPMQKIYLAEAIKSGQIACDFWGSEYGNNKNSADEIKALFGGKRVFDFSKPTKLINNLLSLGCPNPDDSLILDFFSGSATTAHAVMQLNAEDGGKRKYICVQLPEETPEGSEARKAGYNTICEIGKERIRRAGKKIKEEAGFMGQNLDTGFRVLRLDSSNMEDIYFEPIKLKQDDLFSQVDNVKPDRSELDLLFGCMVDWGVELSYPLRQEEIAGKHLHIVNEGALVACFDKEINLEAIRYVAELKPLRIIFRESCFATDADKLNIYEQFKQLCGWSDDDVYSRIHVL
ncbi:site-specific DNA-methyltransferase [Alloprevotella tannerae]|uniref:site-specific DNA-methyltransferase n=1 Tax=Alloprevotella tannerae TaxID=76122 RepID=UPI0028E5DED5|nr:site-specific DNA-methyltransferase [Alloprevotella tannerae]